MEQIAPESSRVRARRRIRHLLPAQLTDRLTPVDRLFETSSLGIPELEAAVWSLEITGLVETPVSLSLAELKRFPKRIAEAAFVCSGNPMKPTVPLRRAANVRWGGVGLDDLLEQARVRPEASLVWSYGLDHGLFYGVAQPYYVKDMPLSRMKDHTVLVAYEINDEPLTLANGFPARLVIPGYYATNCVKWICRIALMARRPSEFATVRMYTDPDPDAERSGQTTRPVWEVAPESIIVSPAAGSALARGQIEIWGWAWSDGPVCSVRVSTDGGASWAAAVLESARRHCWQRFCCLWSPARAGTFDLRCRATDAGGRTQPMEGARNAVHAVQVRVED